MLQAPNAGMLPSDLAVAIENTSNDTLLLLWKDAQAALKRAVEFESALRSANIKRRFDDLKESGVNTVELGNGYKLKCTTGINYSLRNGKQETEKALAAIEKDGPEGKFLADRLVSWSPKLKKAEYDALPPKYKKLIDAALTTSESKPTLEIVEPVAKK